MIPLTRSLLLHTVREYRDPSTTEATRAGLREWWHFHGIANQFAALMRAAELGRDEADQ